MKRQYRNEEQVKELWKYYQKAAEALGAEKQDPDKQTSFSLYRSNRDFRGTKAGDLNILTRALLGDKSAEKELDAWWGILDPTCPDKVLTQEDLEAGFLEECRPDEVQQLAIRTALTNPISFIQGPPGTGKTYTILHLASCILELAERKGRPVRAAIVSANNAAIGNLHEKVENFFGGAEQPKTPGPNQRRLAENLARLGNSVLRLEFLAYAMPGVGDDADIWEQKKREQALKKAEAAINAAAPQWKNVLEARQAKLQTVPSLGWDICRIQAKDFLSKFPIITSTPNSLRSFFSSPCLGDDLYDYVIIDEVSQCGLLQGLLAMTCAKHLVLVGDEKQLSAFMSKEEQKRLEAHGLYPPEGCDPCYALIPKKEGQGAGENNFLKLCRSVFLADGGPAAGKHVEVMLKSHYRCHKGIIDFCNHRYYNDQLEVKTPNYDKGVKVPIRVRWYQGDYFEHPSEKDPRGKTNSNGAPIRHNSKQLAAFLLEEWPELVRRFREEGVTFCILSPFKEQLQMLKDQIDLLPPELQIPAEELYLSWAKKKGPDGDGGEDSEDSGVEKEINMISTVHSVQGRDFDLVYLLPVEDGVWEWPWSQSGPIINVVVSRARRELILVVSTRLMSRDVLSFLGLELPVWHDTVEDQEGRLSLRALVDYTREALPDPDEAKRLYPRQGAFGFHRTALDSIYDRIVSYRGNQTPASAPEQLLEDCLRNLEPVTREHLEIYEEVHLEDLFTPEQIQSLPPEQRQYICDSARFDFVIRDKWHKGADGRDTPGRVLLVIEADGGFHRVDEDSRRRDEIKDQLVQKAGASYYLGNRKVVLTLPGAEKREPDQWGREDGNFAYLRLPSDGSTFLETNVLKDGAPAGLSEMVFTLEELLERQLRSKPKKVFTFRVKPPDPLDPADAEDGDPTNSYPSERGRNRGVVRGLVWDKQGKMYPTLYYPVRLLNESRDRAKGPGKKA